MRIFSGIQPTGRKHLGNYIGAIREHLELMRDVARRFNSRFGEGTLVVPEHRIPEVGARIMDLQDPTRKMSTTNASVEGTVYVLDEPEAIERKFKRAVTDSGTDIV